jgi:hypothetical protein
MPTRWHRIRLVVKAMELDLHLDSNADRQFVADTFTEWGYNLIAVRDAGVGMPNVITVVVSGEDEQSIIDTMCNDLAFDVKCQITSRSVFGSRTGAMPIRLRTSTPRWEDATQRRLVEVDGRRCPNRRIVDNAALRNGSNGTAGTPF